MARFQDGQLVGLNCNGISVGHGRDAFQRLPGMGCDAPIRRQLVDRGVGAKRHYGPQANGRRRGPTPINQKGKEGRPLAIGPIIKAPPRVLPCRCSRQ